MRLFTRGPRWECPKSLRLLTRHANHGNCGAQTQIPFAASHCAECSLRFSCSASSAVQIHGDTHAGPSNPHLLLGRLQSIERRRGNPQKQVGCTCPASIPDQSATVVTENSVRTRVSMSYLTSVNARQMGFLPVHDRGSTKKASPALGPNMGAKEMRAKRRFLRKVGASRPPKEPPQLARFRPGALASRPGDSSARTDACGIVWSGRERICIQRMAIAPVMLIRRTRCFPAETKSLFNQLGRLEPSCRVPAYAGAREP